MSRDRTVRSWLRRPRTYVGSAVPVLAVAAAAGLAWMFDAARMPTAVTVVWVTAVVLLPLPVALALTIARGWDKKGPASTFGSYTIVATLAQLGIGFVVCLSVSVYDKLTPGRNVFPGFLSGLVLHFAVILAVLLLVFIVFMVELYFLGDSHNSPYDDYYSGGSGYNG